MSTRTVVFATLLLGGVTIAQAATFVVSSTADDGSPNTLRWAIQQNNASPGGNTIQVVPPSTPFVIRLNSFLPAITGPAVVKGATGVAIDASNFIDGNNQNSCPASTGQYPVVQINPGFGPNQRSVYGPGLAVVDSGNVEISNFEIRNVCIGVLLLRSHDNHIHHNTIHNTAGAAGIMVTGDDGTAAGGSTIGLSTRNLIEFNTIYETGDGMECTRGTTFTTYQNNTLFEFRGRPNVPYSQGIECAGNGNTDNVIQNNGFKGYSDGLQLNSASNMTVTGNTIAGTTYGITTAGTGVVIKNNTITANRMGVGPSGNTSSVTITQNRIYGNGKPLLSVSGSAGGTTNPASPALLGIDFGVNGVTQDDLAVSCADGFPDCTAPQNFPTLSASSTWDVTGAVTLKGALASRPNAAFTLEFFANHSLNAAGFGEGEVYLGSISVTTGPTGNVTFSFSAGNNPLGDGSTNAFFTVTATNANGQTSEFSPALALGKATAPAVDFSSLPGNDWPTYGGNWANTHYSTLSQINTTNVANLGGAWLTHLEGGSASSIQQGSPIVINGTMYIQTAQNNVFAINGKTGAVKWKYTSGAGNFNLRGVAVAEGKVFSALANRRVVALDENTGTQVWSTTINDTTYPGGSFPTPLVYYNGLIYVGTGGGDGAYRGRGYALRASDGGIAWTFWGPAAPGDVGGNTWEGDSWKIGGAAPWYPAIVDPQLGLVYWAFGNAGPSTSNTTIQDGRGRGGDNLFASSIVAMDAMTGEYRWHYQMVHHDLWDYDAGFASLFDVNIGGQPKKAIAMPYKTGYVYILDRTNGKPLIGINEMPVGQDAINKTSATQPFPIGNPFTPVCPDPANASRAVPNYVASCIFVPFDDGKAALHPNGTGGGADIGATSYSPKTGLLYVPAGIVNSAFSISLRFFRPLGENRAGTLTAMDPTTNRIVWQRQWPWALGHENTMATAGDLLFVGQPDGYLVGLDLNNQGRELWRWQTGAGLGVGNMISYAIDGEQYVAVLSGGIGLEYNTAGGDSLWALKLGGTVPQAAAFTPPSVRQPIGAAAVAGTTVGNTVRLAQTSATSAESNNQNAMFPQNMTVPVGTTVTFLNAATNTQPHCATQFFEGLFNLGPLAPAQAATYTFTQAGEYFYNDCTNPQTTGKIVVQ